MKLLAPSRLSLHLLLRACEGEFYALDTVRRRVAFLQQSGRIGLASVMGVETQDQRVVVGWLRSFMKAHPRDAREDGVSEEAQCQVFELVYPLVAHLPEVRAQVAIRTAESPRLLGAMLRISRELLGAPNVTAKLAGLRERATSPFLFLGELRGGGPVAVADRRRVDTCVRLLVEAGADLNFRVPLHGPPLLVVARQYPGRLHVITALIRHGADVLARNDDGENILHQAVWRTTSAGVGDDFARGRLVKVLLRVLPAAAVKTLMVMPRTDGRLASELLPGSPANRLLQAKAREIARAARV